MMTVSLPISQAEFDANKQQDFKAAIAKAAGEATRVDSVAIDKIEAISGGRRHLLAEAVHVDFSVKALDRAAAEDIQDSLTQEAINKELEAAGLPPALCMVC